MKGTTVARYAALVLLCSWLSACAIIAKPPKADPGIVDPAAWQVRQEQLRELDIWSLQGRVATGQLLGWTGNLSWRQDGEVFNVRLAGPLGAGGFRASGTLDLVTIRTSERRMVTTQPDMLVEETLGWTFPLQPLRYWAQGRPAPGDYESISVDAQGRLIGLVQSGWRLTYLEYAEVENQPALPKRIVLDNGETRIRLVVDRWFNLGGELAAN